VMVLFLYPHLAFYMQEPRCTLTHLNESLTASMQPLVYSWARLRAWPTSHRHSCKGVKGMTLTSCWDSKIKMSVTSLNSVGSVVGLQKSPKTHRITICDRQHRLVYRSDQIWPYQTANRNPRGLCSAGYFGSSAPDLLIARNHSSTFDHLHTM